MPPIKKWLRKAVELAVTIRADHCGPLLGKFLPLVALLVAGMPFPFYALFQFGTELAGLDAGYTQTTLPLGK